LLYGNSRGLLRPPRHTGEGTALTATGGRPPNAATADEVLLGLARMAMDASVRAADDLGGVSPVQLRALTALRQMKTANLAALAEEMGVTVSTASRLVDRLVSAEWVDRTPSPQNRREISLTLSDTGRKMLRRYDRHRVQRLSECLDLVPPERRDAVVDALAELVHLARHPDRGATAPGIR
jgi:DNA-binding MarR family transcriptional regulator